MARAIAFDQLPTPLRGLETLGRLVADLGFSGVVEKFEEHWGRRPTRWLLLVIGLGVGAVCVGAIWQWIVSPILKFLQSPQISATLWSVALACVAVGAGVSLASGLGEGVLRWRRVKEINSILAETRDGYAAMSTSSREALEDSRETAASAREVFDEANHTFDQSRTMLEASIMLMRAAIENDASMGEEERLLRLENMRLAESVLHAPDKTEGDHD